VETEERSAVSKLITPPNAVVAVEVTVLGAVYEVPALPPGYDNKLEIALLYKTPLIDANELFAASTFMDVRVGNHAKSCPPRLVSPVPIFTVVNTFEPKNVWPPKVVTVFGMFIEVK
jgi:hypothetical protein